MVTRYEEIRDRRGLTNYQVAARAGIPKSTLYDWLRRAKRRPGAGMSVKNTVAVAKALEVDPRELLRGE